MNAPGKTAAKAFSDRRDRLVSAEEPLASLQFNCGGTIPGTIAIPSLLESVRKAREYGLKIARTMQAQDDHEAITAWTRKRKPRDVMLELTSAGIPAGHVQRSRDLESDPQLLHRGFYRELDHAVGH